MYLSVVDPRYIDYPRFSALRNRKVNIRTLLPCLIQKQSSAFRRSRKQMKLKFLHAALPPYPVAALLPGGI